MGKETAISWTDHTFNLWWGCEHALAEPDAEPGDISEECRNCYAATFDKRVGGDHWSRGAEPRWFGDAYWAKLHTWNAAAERIGERRRVFVASMADWAQRHRDPMINAKMNAVRARLWREVNECLWLDFLMLTKRAERLAELLPWSSDGTPWPNVWVGVTAGTRRSLWRVRKLREIRAVVRFVSAEPLLDWISGPEWDDALGPGPIDHLPVHWLIVGDESGGTKMSPRRAVDLSAVAAARDAAERHGVAFHLKQLHDGGRKVHLPMFRGQRHAAFPEVRRD